MLESLIPAEMMQKSEGESWHIYISSAMAI